MPGKGITPRASITVHAALLAFQRDTGSELPFSQRIERMAERYEAIYRALLPRWSVADWRAITEAMRGVSILRPADAPALALHLQRLGTAPPTLHYRLSALPPPAQVVVIEAADRLMASPHPLPEALRELRIETTDEPAGEAPARLAVAG